MDIQHFYLSQKKFSNISESELLHDDITLNTNNRTHKQTHKMVYRYELELSEFLINPNPNLSLKKNWVY